MRFAALGFDLELIGQHAAAVAWKERATPPVSGTVARLLRPGGAGVGSTRCDTLASEQSRERWAWLGRRLQSEGERQSA
jgi:hypothetical protein